MIVQGVDPRLSLSRGWRWGEKRGGRRRGIICFKKKIIIKM